MIAKWFSRKNQWLDKQEIENRLGIVMTKSGRMQMHQIDRRARAMNKLFHSLRKDGMTYKEIGELMGVSGERARQRVMKYNSLISQGVVSDA